MTQGTWPWIPRRNGTVQWKYIQRIYIYIIIIIRIIIITIIIIVIMIIILIIIYIYIYHNYMYIIWIYIYMYIIWIYIYICIYYIIYTYVYMGKSWTLLPHSWTMKWESKLGTCPVAAQKEQRHCAPSCSAPPLRSLHSSQHPSRRTLLANG